MPLPRPSNIAAVKSNCAAPGISQCLYDADLLNAIAATRWCRGRLNSCNLHCGFLCGVGNPERFTHSDQVCEGSCRHLAHDLPSMYLQRYLGNAQHCRRLLIEKSRDHERQYLSLAGTQERETILQFGQICLMLAIFTIACEGGANGRYQRFAINGLCQELDCARLHRANTRRNVAVCRDKDDGQA